MQLAPGMVGQGIFATHRQGHGCQPLPAGTGDRGTSLEARGLILLGPGGCKAPISGCEGVAPLRLVATIRDLS